jgi:hypothetical protein
MAVDIILDRPFIACGVDVIWSDHESVDPDHGAVQTGRNGRARQSRQGSGDGQGAFQHFSLLHGVFGF